MSAFLFFDAKRIASKSSIFFHPLIVDSFDLPSYDSNLTKGNTPRLLSMCLRGKQMTYFEDVKEGFAWGTGGWRKLYRLT